MKSKICLLIAVLALAVVSCHENDIVWNTENLDYRTGEFDIPAIKVHAPLYQTMCNKLDFDSLLINDDDVICIRYLHSERIEWTEEFGIDDFPENGKKEEWAYNLGELEWVSSSTLKGEDSHSIKLTTSEFLTDSYIDEAILSNGKLILTFNVPTASVEVTIHELKNNGEEFVYVFDASKTEADLTGYTVKTNNKKELEIHYKITINSNTSLSGLIKFELSLSDLEVSYMTGYFGYKEDDYKGEMKFDFFSELDGFDGVIGFREGELKGEVFNWTGIPMKMSSEIYFNNTPDERLFNISLNIPVAKIEDNQDITPSKTLIPSQPIVKVEFEKDEYPTELVFEVLGIMNPDGHVENFIDKKVEELARVDLTLTVPLYIRVDAYQRKDSVKFDYNKIIKDDDVLSESIENFVLTLTVNNQLPFDVTLAVDAIDEDGIIVNNICEEKKLMRKESNQIIDIEVDQSLLDSFRKGNVKKLVLTTTAKTVTPTDPERYEKVKKNDYIDIAVSAHFKSKIPITLFK